MFEVTDLQNDPILNYLSNIAKMKKGFGKKSELKYVGIEDLVLQHGIHCKPFTFPANYERGKLKECYNNALDLALAHPNLTYVEGYAMGVIPTPHAWCVDSQLNVYDPTWKADYGQRYFGIPFKTRFVLDTVMAKGTYGVLENWEQKFPLLTGEIDIEKVKSKRKAFRTSQTLSSQSASGSLPSE